MRIGDRSWHTKPGSFVKVPANEEHSLTNTGDEDLSSSSSTTRRTSRPTKARAEKFDVIVIGTGQAGPFLAARLTDTGQTVR